MKKKIQFDSKNLYFIQIHYYSVNITHSTYRTRYLIQSDNTVNYSFKAADIQKAFVKKIIERATADFTL